MARTVITLESPVDLVSTDINADFYYQILGLGNRPIHRYRHSIAGIDKRTGFSIVEQEGDTTKANVHLDRASAMLYAWMYSQVNANDREVLEFTISRDKQKAFAIEQALVSLIEADRLNGIIQIYYQHGIDLGVQKDDLLDAAMPENVKAILLAAKMLKRRLNGGAKISNELYREGY